MVRDRLVVRHEAFGTVIGYAGSHSVFAVDRQTGRTIEGLQAGAVGDELFEQMLLEHSLDPEAMIESRLPVAPRWLKSVAALLIHPVSLFLGVLAPTLVGFSYLRYPFTRPQFSDPFPSALSRACRWAHEWAHVVAGIGVGGVISPVRKRSTSLGTVICTDLTWLWLLPLRLRIGPLVAGALSDCLLLASVLVIRLTDPGPVWDRWLRAFGWFPFFSLASQVALYLRSDLAHLIAHGLSYPGLQEDAVTFRYGLTGGLPRPQRLILAGYGLLVLISIALSLIFIRHFCYRKPSG